MQRRVTSSKLQNHPRSGMAPLELVLYLPIMLFVMALMMIMGTAGAWKRSRTMKGWKRRGWKRRSSAATTKAGPVGPNKSKNDFLLTGRPVNR